MEFRRILATIIISAITISNTITTLADNNIEHTVKDITDNENITENDIEKTITSIPDLNKQLDEIYTAIGDKLGVDKIYIKQLHILAGGKAIYAEKKPDIKNDITIENMDEPLHMEGANINYIKADFIDCDDDKIERPSPYYLPDALYSISYDVISLMSQRYHCNRKGYQTYFNSLQEEVKKNISFYEALLLYTGTDKETVDNFYKAYEKILYDKDKNENVVEQKDNGNIVIKNKFLTTLNNIGINSNIQIKYLANTLQFDKQLAINDSVENLQEDYNVPYKLNYTSRENMMIAAASLVGKVRYVWGGGHSGASYIDGINPIWQRFEEMYPDEPTSVVENEQGEEVEVTNIGFKTCIKPSGSWCPIHGYSSSEYHGGNIYSLQEYVDISAERLNASELLDDKYKEMLIKVNYNNGINIHTLDGLDCSGFASWLYNQITDKYEINSTASKFTEQNGLIPVEYGSDIFPGDIFAWTKHIVIVVGKVKEGSKAYVTVEQTPNVLKYGVIYYSGASSSDIELAKRIASEANELIGGLNSSLESPHIYCMDSVGIYTVEEDISNITIDNNIGNNSEIVENSAKKNSDSININDANNSIKIENIINIENTDNNNIEQSENNDANNSIKIENIINIENTDNNNIEQSENNDENSAYDNILYDEYNYNNENKYNNGSKVLVTKQYREIGRFKDSFLDEDVIIHEYNNTIKDMNADEIIQHTLTKLPISYVTGYNNYNGDIFDKTKIAINIGISIE